MKNILAENEMEILKAASTKLKTLQVMSRLHAELTKGSIIMTQNLTKRVRLIRRAPRLIMKMTPKKAAINTREIGTQQIIVGMKMMHVTFRTAVNLKPAYKF